MTGFRITARALDSRLVSEQVLKEYRGLEECAEPESEHVVSEDAVHRVVFVLEEELERIPGEARRESVALR